MAGKGQMYSGGGVAVDIDTSDLERLARQVAAAPKVLKQEMRKAGREATNAIRTAERAAMPRGRTGKLKSGVRTWVKMTGSDVSGKVRPMARYAHLVQAGARPHIIRPRRKKALAWSAPSYSNIRTPTGRISKRPKLVSAQVVTRIVHHPGMRARDFVITAIQRSAGQVKAAFGKAAERLANHVAHGGGASSGGTE